MPKNYVTRRTALKFAGLIALAANGAHVFRGTAAQIPGKGYGRDPNLHERPVTWALTLSSHQLAMLKVLADIVLPADPPHPSAGTLGVHNFLNEWLSAPYPQMQADQKQIANGLEELDRATREEHDRLFIEATLAQKIAVFDQVCLSETGEAFCRRLIALVCAGYYTTREGHRAIGYVGNIALERFDGPSPEIIQHLQRAVDQLF